MSSFQQTSSTTVSKTNSKCCSTSLISDWTIIISLLIIQLVIDRELYPHIQCIPENDSSCSQNVTTADPQLSFPLKESTVPFQLIVVLFPLSFLIFVLCNFYFIRKNVQKQKRNGYKIYLSKMEIIARTVLTSATLTIIITDVIKNAVGRPRPNFYQNNDSSDRRLSFPSGHASFSWSILFLLTLYLLHSLQTMRELKFSTFSVADNHQSNEKNISHEKSSPELKICDKSVNKNMKILRRLSSPIIDLKKRTSEEKVYQKLSATEIISDIKESNDEKLENVDISKDKQSIKLEPFELPSLDTELGNGMESGNETLMQMQSAMNYLNGDAYFGLCLWMKLRNHCLLCIILALIPTFIATYVSCTRLTDYKHHYSDVLGGSLIGISIASVTFYIYKVEYYFGYRISRNCER